MKGENIKNHEEVAIKIIDLNLVNEDPIIKKCFEAECKISKLIDHTYLLKA